MPEVRYYTVKQTRMVRVRANNTIDAAAIGKSAFEDGQDANGSIKRNKMPYAMYGDTVSHVVETGLETTLERMT